MVFTAKCAPMPTHDGRLRFVCNCPSYMSNPMPELNMTLNYFELKKRKFKGICHLLCQPVSKSQTLVLTSCKMPAKQFHYRPLNSHVFSNSRPAAFHALRARERAFHWTWPILDYFCVIQPLICRIKPKWLF